METSTFVHNKPSVLSGVIAFIPPLTRITETTNAGCKCSRRTGCWTTPVQTSMTQHPGNWLQQLSLQMCRQTREDEGLGLKQVTACLTSVVPSKRAAEALALGDALTFFISYTSARINGGLGCCLCVYPQSRSPGSAPAVPEGFHARSESLRAHTQHYEPTYGLILANR